MALQATFLTDYVHTSMILIIILIFVRSRYQGHALSF